MCIRLCATALVALGLAGCGVAGEGPYGTSGLPADEVLPTERALIRSNPEVSSMPAQPDSVPSGQPDSVPPAQSDAQPGQPGRSDSGASQTLLPAQPDAAEQTDPSGWQVFRDEQHGFQVAHPAGFRIDRAEAGTLTAMRPAPAAAFGFHAPGNELAARTPRLTVRIFANPDSLPLEEWLRSAGLASGLIESHKVGERDGLKVSSQTFIAPGWSVYLADGARVFQLTPLGEDGERMLDSFTIGAEA
ncbi:MAG TPA: hypothetical protein VFS21_17805 [Roseiflexaceae bacterium]|nr:hypothetical protein [Roseiflexaceae bacterium]